MGIRKRLIEAAVEDALVAFCGTRRQGEAASRRFRGKGNVGPITKRRDAASPLYSDEQLWAKFAWRFGWGMLRELTLQGVAEMREHRRPVEDRDKPKVLQRLINGVWKDSKRTTAREAKQGEAGAEPKAGRLGSIGSDRVEIGSSRVGVGSSRVGVGSGRVGIGSGSGSVESGSGDEKDNKQTTAREAK